MTISLSPRLAIIRNKRYQELLTMEAQITTDSPLTDPSWVIFQSFSIPSSSAPLVNSGSIFAIENRVSSLESDLLVLWSPVDTNLPLLEENYPSNFLSLDDSHLQSDSHIIPVLH